MMKKRILSLIIVISLLSTCFAGFSVNAEAVPTVSFVNDSTEPSDNLRKVNVCLSDNPGITSLIVDISFDGDSIELIQADDSGNFSEWKSDSPNGGNNFRLVWEGDLLKENITFDGIIATLLFDVSEAENREYPITATFEDGIDAVLDCKGKNVFFDAVGCTLTVEHKTETEQLSFRDDGDHYTVIGIGTVTGSSVDIPEEFNGKPVTKIEEGAFYGCSGLTSVTIPESVTTIGGYSFGYCTGLTSVTIPNSVTTIGDYAFYQCSGFTGNLVLGNSVTTIGDWAFDGCSGLTSVSFGKYVEKIGGYAFRNCTSLTEIVFGAELREICIAAFKNCNKVKELTLPSSLEVIGIDAFSSCRSLEAITIPDSVRIIGDSAFEKCASLVSVVIPDGVTTIEMGTFSGCTNLKDVTIPNGVTAIGIGAFAECRSLETVDLPESVTTIGLGAFSDCSGLISINIPSGVSSIGYYAFEGCTSLSSINVSEKNEKFHIEGNCLIETEKRTLLLGCSTSVIPDNGSVTTIANNAFTGLLALTSINIPKSIESIGDYAFDGCKNLQSATYDGTKDDWKEVAVGDKNEDLLEHLVFLTNNISLSGKISSFNTNNATTIELRQNGAVKYSETIAATSGNGQVTQQFSLTNVEPGTYDLVVTKVGHIDYTVTGITVSDSDIDLTKSDKPYADITLIAGDVDGDGLINGGDVQIIRLATNINKSAKDTTFAYEE